MIFDSEFLKFLETMNINLKLKYKSTFTGESVSRQRGSGMDFKDYRHYEIGDDYRYIDWNLYSRLEQLYLKEFIEEKGNNIYIMIDSSESMAIGSPSKIEIAVKIAAALSYIGLSQMDRVGIALFADNLISVSRPIKGKNQVHNLLNILEGVKTEGKTNIRESINRFVHKFKNPGLLILLSDFLVDKDSLSELKILKIRGWRILLIHILAEEDINPGLGETINLIDIETGAKKEIYIDDELLLNYKVNLEKHNKVISNFTKKFSISYFRTDTKMKIKDIIYQLLGTGKGIM